MSAKHTPGPWLAASHPSSVSGLPIVARPSGRSIASVTFFHLGEAFASHDAESRANARLIAAAPTLLEALQAIADGEGDAVVIAQQTLVDCDLWDAKATGEA